ncbi:MAG: response regulator [Polyangiaceae bacterium]|nr:response regulator [Polyangiaceae bacterium]
MNSKLLYIEDNEQNFYLVSFILTIRGHDVIWAKDGQAGIAAAVRDRPRLILLDIQLPVMDGYAVAHAIRANPELDATPIVALTSYAMPGDRDKAFEAGCTGYVEKPIDPGTFAEQIESYLCAAPEDCRSP